MFWERYVRRVGGGSLRTEREREIKGGIVAVVDRMMLNKQIN